MSVKRVILFGKDMDQKLNIQVTWLIELNKWIRAAAKRLEKFSSQVFTADTITFLQKILVSAVPIRHSAVHRLPLAAQEVSTMVHSAISFAATLGDVACAQRLTAVHQGLQRYIWAWELHKNLREGNLKLERREIARRRKELEERQERAVERMLTDAKEYRVTIESQLEESLRRILGRSEGDGLGSGDPGAQDDSNRAQEQREDKDDNQLPTDTRSPSLTLSLSHLPHQTLLEATTAKQNCRRLAWIAGTSEHGSNVQL